MPALDLEINWQADLESEEELLLAPKCPRPARHVISGFPRYHQTVGSLPWEERQKTELIGAWIRRSFEVGCSPILGVRVVGYADRDPHRGPVFEQRISLDRARAVELALKTSVGSAPVYSNIVWQTMGAGTTSLIVPIPRNELERARNRRVEVWLSVKRPEPRSPYQIRWAQRCLNRLLNTSLPVSGMIEPGTRAALRAFQRRSRMTVNGALTMPTWAGIVAACGFPSIRPVQATPPGSACAYFFKGGFYIRYNIASNKVDVGPTRISGAWPLPASTTGALDFERDIDAAVNLGNGFTHFFKGSNCVEYNMATNVASTPVPISSTMWRALPSDFHSGVDAAVNWGVMVFFFKGPNYAWYSLSLNTAGSGPIAQDWPLPSDFHSDIDAVVNWGNGIVYFFKGPKYVKFVLAKNEPEPGTSLDIDANWPELPRTPIDFTTRVRAAVNWSFPIDLAGVMRAAGLTVNEVPGWRTRVSSAGPFAPLGIIMHHTGEVGPGSLDTIVKGRGGTKPLPGPLANFHVAKSGVISIVSRGPSNHAGDGPRLVLSEVNNDIAPSGSARSRNLSEEISGNPFFYGFENENLGRNDARGRPDPWPDVQRDTMLRASVALCHLHCWTGNRVIGHREWNPQKPDPKDIDMDQFRAQVWDLL